MEEKKETFSYSYSAKQQEEIKKTRQKYMPREEDKMEQLRKLDKSAARPGMMLSITVGIIGTMILGLGMSCCMVWSGSMFIPGIIIGVVGIILLAAAYPLYMHITKKRREKLASEIIRLTDELMRCH